MCAEAADERAMQLSVMQVQMVHFIKDIIRYSPWEYQVSKLLKLKNELLIMHNPILIKT